jgi:hypothetical protein
MNADDMIGMVLKGADRVLVRFPGTGKAGWMTMAFVLFAGMTFLFLLSAISEPEPVKPVYGGNMTFNFTAYSRNEPVYAEPSRTPKELRLAVYCVAMYLLGSMAYWDLRGVNP